MLAEKISRVKSRIEQLGQGQALGQMAPVVLAELGQAEDLAKELEASLEIQSPEATMTDHERIMDVRIALSELARSVGETEWEKIKEINTALGNVQRNCARSGSSAPQAANQGAANG